MRAVIAINSANKNCRVYAARLAKFAEDRLGDRAWSGKCHPGLLGVKPQRPNLDRHYKVTTPSRITLDSKDTSLELVNING